MSSESLAGRIIEGIISSGINVYDIALCATPLQYFSLHHLNLDGGILVTGGHNPPDYNGFKLSIGNETIFGCKIQKIKEIMQKNALIENPAKGHVEHYDILTRIATI